MRYGRIRMDGSYEFAFELAEMSQPVRCRCGGIYDLGKVTIIDRYLDCSTWQTPCCRQRADDRRRPWTSIEWYEHINKSRFIEWDEY